jgi:hypothetical protein
MSAPIDITATLDPSGGANDTVSEQASFATDSGVYQIEITGSSTSVNVHLETRLAADLGWADLPASATGVQGGYSDVGTVELSDIRIIRFRFVNQDGTPGNTADVRGVLVTQ